MERIGNFDVFDWTEIDAGLDENCSLLLGNGFSISLLNNVFSYRQIATQITAGNYHCGQGITNLLGAQNANFESLIFHLETASPIVDVYGGTGQHCTIDAGTLRRDLIRSISSLHPQLPLDPPIQTNNYIKCGKFLKRFKNIFTTNYDTLLYWAIMRGRVRSRFDDGFRRDSRTGLLSWREDRDQNLFYLHGALHLFMRSSNWITEESNLATMLHAPIIKLEMDNQGTILPQVIQHIRNGNFPLTVAEGHHKQKINKIVSNSYLRHGLLKFSSLKQEVLVSYGWSGGANEDQHLFDALKESSVRYWVFGLYNPNITELRRIDRQFGVLNASRSRDQKPPIQPVFYNTASLRPWG